MTVGGDSAFQQGLKATEGAAMQDQKNRPGIRRLCVAIDVDNFTRWDHEGQAAAQQGLREVLAAARTATDLPGDHWTAQPSGDGELDVLSPGIDERNVIRDFVIGLRQALDETNRGRRPFDRLRLRVAIHEGVVELAQWGATGRAAAVIHRLLSSQDLRKALRDNPSADLALIVSQPIFDDHIGRDHDDFDADSFRPAAIDVPTNLFSTYAWIWIPYDDLPRDGIPQIGRPPTPRRPE